MKQKAAAILFAAATSCLVGGCSPTGSSDDSDQTRTGAKLMSQPATLAASCSGCHAAGNSAIVSLDDLSAEAIAAAMTGYRDDPIGTSVMHRLARGYSDEHIQQIAAHLASENE